MKILTATLLPLLAAAVNIPPTPAAQPRQLSSSPTETTTVDCPSLWSAYQSSSPTPPPEIAAYKSSIAAGLSTNICADFDEYGTSVPPHLQSAWSTYQPSLSSWLSAEASQLFNYRSLCARWESSYAATHSYGYNVTARIECVASAAQRGRGGTATTSDGSSSITSTSASTSTSATSTNTTTGAGGRLSAPAGTGLMGLAGTVLILTSLMMI